MPNAQDRTSALRGHYWTVRTGVLGWLPGMRSLVYPAPASIPWSTRGYAARWGEVTLSGSWTKQGSHALLVVLHGLGGNADSPYVRHLAYFAARRGLDCLRLNFRGADRSGAGLYHCAATDDVELALADAQLRDYRDVFLAGHSLGGQVALHYALNAPDPRLRAVAAVCPPLDLVAITPCLEASAYRPLMLANMNRTYRRFWQARGQFLGSLFEHPQRVARYKWLRDWDDAVTARYGGFTDSQHYYVAGSIGNRWPQLRIPTAVYLMDDDPIVPARAVEACAREMQPHVEVFRLPGGHLGAPHVPAMRGAREPLQLQIVRWLIARQRAANEHSRA